MAWSFECLSIWANDTCIKGKYLKFTLLYHIINIDSLYKHRSYQEQTDFMEGAT